LAIPNFKVISVSRAARAAPGVRLVAILALLLPGGTIAAAADWGAPEQQLARKIVTITGSGPASLNFDNRSSLGRRDRDIIQNGLRSALEGLGIRLTKSDRATAAITVFWSENVSSYVWVAQIIHAGSDPSVVIVTVPRPSRAGAAHDSVPIRLLKLPLWTQPAPMLDVAVLDEGATPTRIAVLGAENISLYRLSNGKWQTEQTLEIAHARPWPRDLRGRLVPGKDHLLDVYLPDVFCRSGSGSAPGLSCRESEDPWPMIPSGWNGAVNASAASGEMMSASAAVPEVFFARSRNFFTGGLTRPIGKIEAVAPFYSAAFLPRDSSALWLFTSIDGQVHIVDGVSDQGIRLPWGSDLTSVKTSCGAGWQVLATTPDEGTGESVRAYEFPERDPVAVSGTVELSGEVSALWTEAKGGTAVVIAKNQVTGNYEAFRLAVACNQ
jgi:hypothetical protein